MLNLQAFAKREGVTESIVRKWIARHGLPYIQIGHRNYIDDADYTEWIASHRQVAAEKQPKPRDTRVALPKQCRKSGILSKIHKIY